MQTIIRKSFTLAQPIVVVAIIGLLVAIALPKLRAQDTQGYPSAFMSPTNLPSIVTAGANSNNLASFIPIYNNSGLGLQWKFNESGLSSTSNGVIILEPSVDGTNIATTPPWVWAVPANAGTVVIGATNWSSLQLKGFKALVITGMTNVNTTTLTNQGVVANRPNT